MEYPFVARNALAFITTGLDGPTSMLGNHAPEETPQRVGEEDREATDEVA
jgi:hypothetical protein